MDLGRGGEGESVQPFRLSENSWSHHFMAPQEWRVCFPPVDTTLKGCDEMRNSAKEGKVSEGGYEGAPACTEQLLVGSVSRSGRSFACSQLPSVSPSCRATGPARATRVLPNEWRGGGWCERANERKTPSTGRENAEGWKRTLGRKMPVSSGVKWPGSAWGLWGPWWFKSCGFSQFFNG